MIARDFAERFAAEWIAAWNAHDLDRVLAHYGDDFTMSSPYIAAIAGEPSGRLEGKSAVRAYWTRALERYPALRFEAVAVCGGVDSIVLVYRGVAAMAAETFFFGADGRIVRACAHYASAN